MPNWIILYKPLATYNEVEKWYRRMISLEEVQEALYKTDSTIMIDNSTNNYGQYDNEGVIKINLSNHVYGTLNNLIETIAHEIAHSHNIWNHGSGHSGVTSTYKKQIISGLDGVRTKPVKQKVIQCGQPIGNVREVETGSSSLDGIYAKLTNYR